MKASEIAAEIMERRDRTRHVDGKQYSPSVQKILAMKRVHEPLLDAREMAKHLGICVTTLSKLTAEGLPFFTISGLTKRGKGIRRRFRASEVEEWLRQRNSSNEEAA